MDNTKKNKAIEEKINWIKDDKYTEEVISISDVELLSGLKRETISELQGDYPVDIIFSAMQKVEITYRNKYYGIRKATIVGGFDAVRYKYCMTDAYEGDYLSNKIIGIEFIGEEAKIVESEVE